MTPFVMRGLLITIAAIGTAADLNTIGTALSNMLK